MTIGWFRDLVIIIFGLVAAGVLIAFAVMGIAIFRRLRVILDSLKVTSANIEEISTFARSQVTRPLARLAAIVAGISKGIETVSGFLKKKEQK